MKNAKKIDVKIHQLNNKNQFIINHNEMIYFQSYDSLIASYNTNTQKLIIGCDWDYSNTTRKHLYIFMSEYCFIYSGFTNDLYYSKNKRQLIIKLIKNKVVSYDKNMQ